MKSFLRAAAATGVAAATLAAGISFGPAATADPAAVAASSACRYSSHPTSRASTSANSGYVGFAIDQASTRDAIKYAAILRGCPPGDDCERLPTYFIKAQTATASLTSTSLTDGGSWDIITG